MLSKVDKTDERHNILYHGRTIGKEEGLVVSPIVVNGEWRSAAHRVPWRIAHGARRGARLTEARRIITKIN